MPEKTMKVKIIRDTVAGGTPVFRKDKIDVRESEGKLLIALGKAEPLDAREPEKKEK